jgi:hypothetical protein
VKIRHHKQAQRLSCEGAGKRCATVLRIDRRQENSSVNFRLPVYYDFEHSHLGRLSPRHAARCYSSVKINCNMVD